jgi:Tol biopolymer transport system component
MVVVLSVLASHPMAAPKYSNWTAPLNLGTPVNSELEELDPFISKDGLSLYFGSARSGGFGGTDIWVSRRGAASAYWGLPENLGAAINTPFNDGAPALSVDGHYLLFNSNRPGGFGASDLYVSRRHNKHDDLDWAEPQNLGPIVNSPANDQGPAWFEDESSGFTTLLFSSARTGGLGGDDIYASTLEMDGRFGPPILISELSSPSADRAPSISRDGLAVIMASDRPGTLGGLDLWASTRESTTDPWSTPLNLGEIVNSPFADSGPALSFEGTALVFSSALRFGTIGTEGRFDLWVSSRDKRRGKE